MTNNYDKIAPFYDKLSRLVFFKSQVNAQVNQLKFIPLNSSLLIIGGGTGWILEEISKVHSSGLVITYLEISEKMISLSKGRDYKENQVQFIHSAIEDFTFTKKYDVILTPFLFDNFSAEKSQFVFGKLNLQLNTGGYWFFTDFYLGNDKWIWWKTVFLKTMYSFFKFFGIVEATNLVDYSSYFLKDFKKVDEQFYYGRFINASIYLKK